MMLQVGGRKEMFRRVIENELVCALDKMGFAIYFCMYFYV